MFSDTEKYMYDSAITQKFSSEDVVLIFSRENCRYANQIPLQ